MADEIYGEIDTSSEDTTVLELFGIKLNVKNPRLAEALLMDAKDALTTDVRHLGDADSVRRTQAEMSQAVPDAIVAVPTVRDSNEARERGEFRQRVEEAGSALGFAVEPDGTWRSPTEVRLAVRMVPKPVSAAAAADFVSKLDEARRAGTVGYDSALVVTAEQTAASDFALAIRQLKLHDAFRTVAVDNLDLMRALFVRGVLDHVRALALLSPVSDADVGDMLEVVRRASS